MKGSLRIQGSSRKKSKWKKSKNFSQRRHRAKEDRLSSLPDELIHRILSFLDARLAVQTSVLSKRWRFLWTSLPFLNFLDESFHDTPLFQNFVDNVLSQRDASSHVKMLKFVSYEEMDDFVVGDDDEFMVDSIIDYVILKGIEVLSITASVAVRNLSQLSACQTLTTLKLGAIATETVTFDLVSLEKLYLSNCRFECIEEELDPFSGCPNLKCLFLDGLIYYGKVESFIINAPQLTDLRISCLQVDDIFDPDCVIELSTPKLTSFSYHNLDWDLYGFSFNMDLPFIEKVNIDLGSFMLVQEKLMMSRAKDLSLQLIELFEVMGSAKSLSISPDIIKVLSKFPSLLQGRSSPFTGLQTFKINRTSSFAIPSEVKAYLFGGSPGFDCC